MDLGDRIAYLLSGRGLARNRRLREMIRRGPVPVKDFILNTELIKHTQSTKEVLDICKGLANIIVDEANQTILPEHVELHGDELSCVVMVSNIDVDQKDEVESALCRYGHIIRCDYMTDASGLVARIEYDTPKLLPSLFYDYRHAPLAPHLADINIYSAFEYQVLQRTQKRVTLKL